MQQKINRQVVLASRPNGIPIEDNFKLVEKPVRAINADELLIENLYFSMDAGFRHWMNEGSGDNYLPEMPLGAAVMSLTLGKVIESNVAEYSVGQLLLGRFAWEEYSIANKEDFLAPISSDAQMPLNYYLGVLGGTGFTAYFGMLDIGKPKEGEVVLISAAAGAVGAIAGQIAKHFGAYTVGMTSSDEKCGYLEAELGYDKVINYKTEPDLNAALKRECPDGIDVYFDNVGGSTLEAALNHIREQARIIMCGAVSTYNSTEAPSGPTNIFQLTTMRATMKGFMYTDHIDRYPEATEKMTGWLEQGVIKNAEYELVGIENTAKAFCHMFQGKNIGKTLLRLEQR